jgi:hypothetical protein
MSYISKNFLITQTITLSGLDIIKPKEGCMYKQKGDSCGTIILASTYVPDKECCFCVQTSKGGLYLMDNSSVIYKGNKFLMPYKNYCFNIIFENNTWKVYNNEGYIGDNNVIINWSEFFNSKVQGAPPLAARRYAIFINGIYNAIQNFGTMFNQAVVNESANILATTLLQTVDLSSIYNSYPKLSNTSLAAVNIFVSTYLSNYVIPTDATNPNVNVNVNIPIGQQYWNGNNPVLPNWIGQNNKGLTKNIDYLVNTVTNIPDEPFTAMPTDANNLLQVVRTPVTNEVAYHFANTPPPAHLISITCSILANKDLSSLEFSKILSVIAIGLADAGIFAWTTKYAYWGARPFQYINGYTPLITTPNFPGYISGHSTFSAVWDQLLSMLLPSSRDMVKYIADLSGISRIYGGIHFSADNVVGLNSGRSIGESVYSSLLTKINTNQSFLV